MPKYEKGKLPYTLKNTENGKLYVRKSVMCGGKQKQIWRLCEPQTAIRFLKVLVGHRAGNRKPEHWKNKAF